MQVKPVCFYLPQFHPNLFNNQNWTPGFTEWTNVVRAQPRFEGHFQPKIPGELGFYDLRLPLILEEQISLAQAHGIYGFCLYYYRFGKKRMLDVPLNNLLNSPKPTLPFFYCWANEDWTRAWDGKSSDIMLKQTYDEITLDGLVADLTYAMRDYRYVRVNNKPVFIIYQLEHLPEPASDWIMRLREKLLASIKSDIILGAVYSHGFTLDMAELVDMVVQFPPHRIPRKSKRRLMSPDTVQPFNLERGDYFESYDDVISQSLEGIDLIKNLHPGVCPDWDNSARRAEKAHILVGSTPDKFSEWVAEAARATKLKLEAGDIFAPFMFVNAWNEWAEGAVLEPSLELGRSYLEALHRGLNAA